MNLGLIQSLCLTPLIVISDSNNKDKLVLEKLLHHGGKIVACGGDDSDGGV